MSDGEWVYVATAEDDRVPPVIAESAEACARKAAEEMDLRHSATDLSNWDRKSDLTGEVNGQRHWRLKVRSHWWDHASIHGMKAGDP